MDSGVAQMREGKIIKGGINTPPTTPRPVIPPPGQRQRTDRVGTIPCKHCGNNIFRHRSIYKYGCKLTYEPAFGPDSAEAILNHLEVMDRVYSRSTDPELRDAISATLEFFKHG